MVQISHEEEAVKEVQRGDYEEEQAREYPHTSPTNVIVELLIPECDCRHKEIYHGGQEQASKNNMKNNDANVKQLI